MRKIVLSNFKGGVGKSTCAVNLAVGIARAGKRVLLLDNDSQASATDALGINGQVNSGTYGLLVDGVSPEELAIYVESNLNMICASKALSGADSWLATQFRREEVLNKRLKKISGYDFVILDTAPAFSLLNLNALAWAQEVWLPVNMEYMALQGVKQVLDNLKIVREELDHDVAINYVIPTFVDSRNSKTTAVLEALRESFGSKVTHGIRTSVRLSEAPSHHQSIFDYAPRSAGAEDFSTLTRRILENG
jgi:chromosome partitioning protein